MCPKNIMLANKLVKINYLWTYSLKFYIHHEIVTFFKFVRLKDVRKEFNHAWGHSPSQADTDSVACTAVTDAALSPFPMMTLSRGLLERERRRGSVGSSFRDQLKQVICARHRRVLQLTWRTRTLMSLVVLRIWESLSTKPSNSICQISFAGRDSQKWLCLKWSFRALTFHNESFQMFNIHH